MKIAIASDHRGFTLKGRIIEFVRSLGHDGVDYGPDFEGHVDYPDFAAAVARAVSRHEVERGILVCGTGVGMCIVANKFADVRAAPCHDDLTAEMSRLHNDANVLCLSADLLGDHLVDRMVEIWLRTEFEGGRHARRLAKIASYEHQDAATESREAESRGVEAPHAGNGVAPRDQPTEAFPAGGGEER